MIRSESPNDIFAVHRVHCEAFGRQAEATLVGRLREESLIFKSLVAVNDKKIVGNIVFSNLLLTTSSGRVKALALAPVAVLPEFQRRRIGAQLINHGLELSKKSEAAAVLVLGDPMYYARFGFSATLAERIKSPYSAAGEAWMALELREGALESLTGTATCPDIFKIVD